MTLPSNIRTLDAALVKAFQRLSVRWPKAFAREKVPILLPAWRHDMNGIPLEAFEEGAAMIVSRFPEDGKIPSPPTLRSAAKRWVKENAPELSKAVPPPPPITPRSAPGRHTDRIYSAMKSLTGAVEVYQWLHQNGFDIHGPKAGKIPDDIVDAAINHIKRQRASRSAEKEK